MLDALLTLTLVALLATFLGFLLRDPRGEDESGPRAATRSSSGGVLRWLAPGVGVTVATGMLLFQLPVMVAFGAAMLVGIVVHVLVGSYLARQAIAFDSELAACLDLVVASLRSGAALVESLATASLEARGEVGAMFVELCDRLRLGEPASAVLDDLTASHSGEGVRLFAFTLASHFDSGGSAATSMGEVARAIRDRIDVVRRVSSQSVETQASVVGILGITYGLALLMWRQYPERVEVFAGSELGSAFIGLSIVLQAIGLAWISSMTRAEV